MEIEKKEVKNKQRVEVYMPIYILIYDLMFQK